MCERRAKARPLQAGQGWRAASPILELEVQPLARVRKSEGPGRRIEAKEEEQWWEEEEHWWEEAAEEWGEEAWWWWTWAWAWAGARAWA